MRVMCFIPFLALVLHGLASDVSNVNWFHLQDESSAWYGRMQPMIEQLLQLAEKIESEYPSSKFGSAAYTDKFEASKDYVLVSNLTDRQSASQKLQARYPKDTWDSDKNPATGVWPADDSNVPDAVYEERSGKLKDEAKGCLEPLIWAALHTNWDEEKDAIRFVTQAVAGLGHFAGDKSFGDQWVSTFLPFTRECCPRGESSIRTPACELGIYVQYASTSLAREVLKEQNIHLVVLYALDGNNETPRKGWEELIAELGGDYTKSLFFLPAELNVVSSAMTGLANAIQSTTLSTTSRPTTLPPTSIAINRPSNLTEWKIDWFHLQDNSKNWYGRMQLMTERVISFADSLERLYPGSRMGAARYLDKSAKVEAYKNWVRETEDYHLISNLTDKRIAIKRLLKAFPATWHPDLPEGASIWPETTSGLNHSVYEERAGKQNDEIRGCLEAMIWTALHANWDPVNDRILRLFTLAVAGLSHYHGDGSQQEKLANEKKDFSRMTFPAGEKSYWPQRVPERGFSTRYATRELAKEVLAETGVKLFVLHGLDANNETPELSWGLILVNFDRSARIYLGGKLDFVESILFVLESIFPSRMVINTEPVTVQHLPTTIDTTTSRSSSETNPESDGSTSDGDCPNKICGKGLLLAVDERPKILELKIVS